MNKFVQSLNNYNLAQKKNYVKIVLQNAHIVPHKFNKIVMLLQTNNCESILFLRH